MWICFYIQVHVFTDMRSSVTRVAILAVVMLLLTSSSAIRFKPRKDKDVQLEKFENDMRKWVQMRLQELESRPVMSAVKKEEQPSVEDLYSKYNYRRH